MTNNVATVLVTALVCFLINAKIGESFGIDVHHRYSDTVKDFLDLNGLPEKGSTEYFAAMAHRDHIFKSRRLAAAGSADSTPSPPTSSPSKSNLLTFFGGNETYQFVSLGFLYYTIVRVGTPSLAFLVALDTGSDLFWLPCDCTSCATSYNISGKAFSLNMYSPSGSSTSSLVPCNSTKCGSERGCSTTRNACSYQEGYLSANTSSTGILVDDTLRLGTDDSPQIPINASITLGCGMIQTGDFLDSGGINGLMGLGMDSISVPSVLASKGLVPSNSLSMCFGPDGLGRIEFGYKGSPDQKTTPFNVDPVHPTYNVTVSQIAVGNNVSKFGFTAVFDSGTSFTYLNDPAYSFIAEAFNSQINETRFRPVTASPFEYCYLLGVSQPMYYTPDMNFTMGGGDHFYVSATTIVFPRTGGNVYCLAIVKSDDINIIGQNFMTGYRMVFDRDEMVLGWKESDCLDLISSTKAPGNSNSTDASPPSSLTPGTTFGNRTRSPFSPPPSPPPPLTAPSNAADLSSISTNILMVMISICFHHFIVLCL